MTNIQFIILIGVLVLMYVASPIFVFIWSYVAARGKFYGIYHSKTKLTITTLLNLKKHGKEN